MPNESRPVCLQPGRLRHGAAGDGSAPGDGVRVLHHAALRGTRLSAAGQGGVRRVLFRHGRIDLRGGLRHRRAGDRPLCQKQKNRPGGGVHRRGGAVCDPPALRPHRRCQRAGGGAGGEAGRHGGGHHRHRCPRQIFRGRMGCPARLRHLRHGACQGDIGGDTGGGRASL